MKIRMYCVAVLLLITGCTTQNAQNSSGLGRPLDYTVNVSVHRDCGYSSESSLFRRHNKWADSSKVSGTSEIVELKTHNPSDYFYSGRVNDHLYSVPSFRRSEQASSSSLVELNFSCIDITVGSRDDYYIESGVEQNLVDIQAVLVAEPLGFVRIVPTFVSWRPSRSSRNQLHLKLILEEPGATPGQAMAWTEFIFEKYDRYSERLVRSGNEGDESLGSSQWIPLPKLEESEIMQLERDFYRRIYPISIVAEIAEVDAR